MSRQFEIVPVADLTHVTGGQLKEIAPGVFVGGQIKNTTINGTVINGTGSAAPAPVPPTPPTPPGPNARRICTNSSGGVAITGDLTNAIIGPCP